MEALPSARQEINALPADLRAKMFKLMTMIEADGLGQMRKPHVKHLDGKLWELRAKVREGLARGLYVALQDHRVVGLHAFVKTSEKTPLRALAPARARIKETNL